jgi:hypothetical protein
MILWLPHFLNVEEVGVVVHFKATLPMELNPDFKGSHGNILHGLLIESALIISCIFK